MYEKINFTQELKKIPQSKLVYFLGAQLKKNENLQKEFIKRFDLKIQKKFIQDYIKECDDALLKSKKAIKPGIFVYEYTKLNKDFVSEKMSYLNVLEKKDDILEALKLCVSLYCMLSKVIAHNGSNEDISKKTTAEKYENKWMKLRMTLIRLYSNLPEDEMYLFDRKTFFNMFKSLYDPMLKSYVFNYIFVRDHVKLHWLKEILRDEDRQFLEDFNY